jgi:hypothetical protein
MSGVCPRTLLRRHELTAFPGGHEQSPSSHLCASTHKTKNGIDFRHGWHQRLTLRCSGRGADHGASGELPRSTELWRRQCTRIVLRACPSPKDVEESKKSAETSWKKSLLDSLSDAIDDGGRRGLRHVCANRCDLPVRAHNVSDPLPVLFAQHSGQHQQQPTKSLNQSAPWACDGDLLSRNQVCMPFVRQQ